MHILQFSTLIMAENGDESSLARQLASLVSLNVPSSFGALPTFSKKPTDLEVSLIDIDSESFRIRYNKLEQNKSHNSLLSTYKSPCETFHNKK